MSAANFYAITDRVMGEYHGFWESKNGPLGRVKAQVRPLSNNRYDGFIVLNRANNPVAVLSLQAATLENDTINFEVKAAAPESNPGGSLLAHVEAACQWKDGKLSGTLKGDLGEGTFEASLQETEASSLGNKPPANVIVLFDGTDLDAWEETSWKVTPDGFLEVGKGPLIAKEKLKNFRLHLEFRTPYMPFATGQARGNSGVYLQGKYEVQVLDSFGLFPLRDNDCGGIYRVTAPRINACRPPMAWQSYDIVYRENPSPTITIQQNGMTIVENAAVPAELVEKGTGGGVPNGGVLMLQDHGNPVQYRNIWVERLGP